MKMRRTVIYTIVVSLGVAVSATIELIPIETEPQENHSAVFLCTSDKPLQSCLIKPPNSQNWMSFNNSDNKFAKEWLHLNRNRYLYYGDGLEKGDCGVVILHPREEDSGTWLCRVEAVGDPVSVTEEVTIYVQEKTSPRRSNNMNAIDVLKRQDSKGSTLTVIPVDVEVEPEEDKSVVFVCQLDKPVEICQIQAPNSEEWISLNNSDLRELAEQLMEGDRFLYYGDGFEKGDCGIVIPRPQIRDNGFWKCNMKAVGEDSFVGGQVEVSVTGTRLTAIPIDVKPQLEEAAVFVCQLTKPVETCMFQPPNSNEWIIFPTSDITNQQKHLERGDKYFYYGDGFENGDCGIVIPSPQTTDNGDWKCKTKAIGDSNYLTGQVEVIFTGPSSPSGVETTVNTTTVVEIPEIEEHILWIIIFCIFLVSSVILLVAALVYVKYTGINSS